MFICGMSEKRAGKRFYAEEETRAFWPFDKSLSVSPFLCWITKNSCMFKNWENKKGIDIIDQKKQSCLPFNRLLLLKDQPTRLGLSLVDIKLVLTIGRKRKNTQICVSFPKYAHKSAILNLSIDQWILPSIWTHFGIDSPGCKIPMIKILFYQNFCILHL